jgi:hypothetical protein
MEVKSFCAKLKFHFRLRKGSKRIKVIFGNIMTKMNIASLILIEITVSIVLDITKNKVLNYLL